MSKPTRRVRWETFTRRTDDPKLAYLEHRLTQAGIPHRRRGACFHGPIMEVDASRSDEAWAILDERRGRFRLDDVRDDHPSFLGYAPHDLV